MAEQSRFVSLDKPIDKFIEDKKNKNTLSKTQRDVSLLTEFLNSKNESRRTEEIPPKELNNKNLSIYKVNKLQHGKCFVRDFHTSRFCIRNLTRLLRSLVRFQILHRLV